MQVTVNIDSATIGGTVEEVFKSLTEEDKKDLARQLMLEVLTKPNATERKVYEDRLAEQIYEKNKNSSYSNDRYSSPEKAKDSYEFRSAVGAYKSSREIMVGEIVQSACAHYKAQVAELVANDPQMIAMYEETREAMIANYPAMVQAAMIHWMAGQMGQIGAAVQAAQHTNLNVGMALTQLTERLKSQGINL